MSTTSNSNTPDSNTRKDVALADAIIAFLLSPIVMMIALALVLLAQGKHTADVFTYYSHVNTPWWLSYAFAAGVEVAVFLFVLHGHKGKSYLFAFAAFATNVVYYAIGGAALLTIELVPVLLLSALLPGVIVGYSHTIAEKPIQVDATPKAAPATAKRHWWQRLMFWKKPAETPTTSNRAGDDIQTPVALPAGTLAHSDANSTPAAVVVESPKQGKAVGKTNEWGLTDKALADMLGVQRQAIGAMRNRGTLTTRVARELPQLEPVHTNGFNHSNGD